MSYLMKYLKQLRTDEKVPGLRINALKLHPHFFYSPAGIEKKHYSDHRYLVAHTSSTHLDKLLFLEM